MKIEVHEKPAAPKIEYPCLMRGQTGVIVLFEDDGHGTAVNGGGPHNIGYRSSSWNMPDFTPFTGSVTLSND